MEPLGRALHILDAIQILEKGSSGILRVRFSMQFLNLGNGLWKQFVLLTSL